MADAAIDPDLNDSSTFDATYLKLPHIEGLIKTYEDVPNAVNLCLLVSSLLSFAFDPKHGWDLKYDQDEKHNHTNFYLVKVEEKPNEQVRTLHTVIKVILNPDDPFMERWDHTIAGLDTAPMLGNRCWAILIRGLDVKLTEYHRDQEPGLREIPCDFTIDGELHETVHIRNNPAQVNCILKRLPDQWPQELTELERVRMANQARIAKAKTDGTALSDESSEPASAAAISEAGEVAAFTNSANISNATETVAAAADDKDSTFDTIATQSVIDPRVGIVKRPDQSSINKMATQMQGLEIEPKEDSTKHGKKAQHEVNDTDRQMTPLTSGSKPKIASSERSVHGGKASHQAKVSSQSAAPKRVGPQGPRAQPSKPQAAIDAKATANAASKGNLTGQAQATTSSSRAPRESGIKR